jgi:enamine deaminase RidA (YjgF/YER057c/UK114 family)
MVVQKLDPATLIAPARSLYAQIAVAEAGRLAFISGQLAYRADGAFVGAGDYAGQARQAFSNLKAALEAVGGKPENVVRMGIYVVGYRPELFRSIFGPAREVFGEAWPVTSSVLLGVQALAMEDWLIEVDAVAAL